MYRDPVSMAAQALLPDSDPELESLEPASRAQIGALWLSRAHNELKTSSVFASLYRELMDFGAGMDVLEMSARAIADEVRHAALCAEVAARYSGASVTLGSVSPAVPPVFSVCSARVNRALFAALHCSVNETLATVYLGNCLDEAVGAIAKAALRAIISDEVRHARIGWAVLASGHLSASERTTISGTMPALLDVCVSAWLAEIEREYPDQLTLGHGCLRHARVTSLVDDALVNLIVPGLEHVQIDSAPARAWIAARPAP